MNNMVMLDSKQQFVLLYKEICADYYFANQIGIIQKRIRIQMKSINIDAWLVNFILSFNGLSPLLIGPKVNFFKLTWHRRLQQCAHLLDSTQPKRDHPNQISSKKLQASQIRFMTHMICHNCHATSDATSDLVQRGKAAGTKLWRIVSMIFHASLNSWRCEIRSRH
jgi:hypothetical protein